uniref:ATP synthase subunit b n=1 Tax=Mandrillus leucophaeus TaxID=9568 RepID=A0A2K6A408_MANLE
MVYGIKKYGPSVAAFADKINEQKLAQLEEAKQASIQQIQNAIDMEKSQQALTQKRLYLFDQFVFIKTCGLTKDYQIIV